jgi:3-phenylpropionate/trans-cinnamate dioxygenase ferredoxin component
MDKQWVKVGRAEEIPEGGVCVFAAGDRHVAVSRVRGVLYALEDLCTHDDGPLGEGCLEGYEIECPRHGARFDVRNGSVCRMPAAAPVQTFPVKEEDGDVLVELELD